MVKVDIGCGLIKQEGWYGIDIREYPGVDYVMDIEKQTLPFNLDSVDEMKAIHVLEHLKPDGLFFFMDEAWRVLKPLGVFHVEVPKADTKAYLINPDHRIQFIEDTFGYFQVPGKCSYQV